MQECNAIRKVVGSVTIELPRTHIDFNRLGGSAGGASGVGLPVPSVATSPHVMLQHFGEGTNVLGRRRGITHITVNIRQNGLPIDAPGADRSMHWLENASHYEG